MRFKSLVGLLLILICLVGYFFVFYKKWPIVTGAPIKYQTNYYKGLFNRLYIGLYSGCGWFNEGCPKEMEYTLVKGADVATFKYAGFACSSPVATYPINGYQDCGPDSYLFKDKMHVIINDSVVFNSDSKTLIFKNNIAYDKNNVYDNGVFPLSDPQNYEKLRIILKN